MLPVLVAHNTSFDVGSCAERRAPQASWPKVGLWTPGLARLAAPSARA